MGICGGGGDIPEMSEDEKKFNALNLASAESMAELQENITPFILADMGYEWEDYDLPDKGEYVPLDTSERPGGIYGRMVGQIEEQVNRKEWDDLPTTDRRLVEIDDPAREQRDLLEQQGLDIQEAGNVRVLKGLAGELDIDPSVEADIERGSSQLRAELFRKLGPGAEGSDAWNRSIAEFEREANSLRYSIRHGEMTTADAIASNRESISRRGEQQKYGQQQGLINPFAVSASVLSSGAKSYQDERFFTADLNQRQSTTESQLIGSAFEGTGTATGGWLSRK